jgi:hypothetical protein
MHTYQSTEAANHINIKSDKSPPPPSRRKPWIFRSKPWIRRKDPRLSKPDERWMAGRVFVRQVDKLLKGLISLAWVAGGCSGEGRGGGGGDGRDAERIPTEHRIEMWFPAFHYNSAYPAKTYISSRQIFFKSSGGHSY